MSFKSKFTYDQIGTENVDAEVVTKPNQAQSVREILMRNSNGMNYDNYKTPYYEEQAKFSSRPLNVIQDMEPVEKLAFMDELQVQMNGLRDKIEDYEEQKQALADQAAAQAAANAAAKAVDVDPQA